MIEPPRHVHPTLSDVWQARQSAAGRWKSACTPAQIFVQAVTPNSTRHAVQIVLMIMSTNFFQNEESPRTRHDNTSFAAVMCSMKEATLLKLHVVLCFSRLIQPKGENMRRRLRQPLNTVPADMASQTDPVQLSRSRCKCTLREYVSRAWIKDGPPENSLSAA